MKHDLHMPRCQQNAQVQPHLLHPPLVVRTVLSSRVMNVVAASHRQPPPTPHKSAGDMGRGPSLPEDSRRHLRRHTMRGRN
jgi:hypothetical protein